MSNRPGRFIIYGLMDPRLGSGREAIRYIGLSTVGLVRPRRHAQENALRQRPGHKERWIRQLVALGLTYEIRILEEFSSAEPLPEAERRWIARARAEGWPLTNATDGGEGAPGHVVSRGARARIAAALTGRTRPPEVRAKISWAQRGRVICPESAAKTAAALRGIKRSPETRAKMAAAQRGNKHCLGRRQKPESIAKISAAKRGVPKSPEHRERLREAALAMTPEARARITLAQRLGCMRRKFFRRFRAVLEADRAA